MLAALFLAALAVLLALQRNRPPDPLYQGKPLSYWLAGYDQANFRIKHPNPPAMPTWAEANEAIRHLGTDSLPLLLDMLRQPNPTPKDRVAMTIRKRFFAKAPPSWLALDNPGLKSLYGLQALGPAASNAVPQLIVIFDNDHSSFQHDAVPLVLRSIGPPASQAMPSLVQALNENRVGAGNVFIAIQGIHAEPQLAVPALIKYLNNSDWAIRAFAANALGAYGKDAQSAVPALTELCSKTTNSDTAEARALRLIQAATAESR